MNRLVRAFPKDKNSVVCVKFPMGSKFQEMEENQCVWMSVNLSTGYERITKHINASNFTWYLEMFKNWLNEPVVVITSGNILHSQSF